MIRWILTPPSTRHFLSPAQNLGHRLYGLRYRAIWSIQLIRSPWEKASELRLDLSLALGSQKIISKCTTKHKLMFNWQDRITLDPKILAGKPVIKGTRLAVEFVIDLLANGWTEAEILKNYPRLSREDILACLGYASSLMKSEKVYPNVAFQEGIDAASS